MSCNSINDVGRRVEIYINDTVSERTNNASNKMLNSIRRDTEPLVPYNTGYLSDSATIDYDNNTISYNTDYAGDVYNSNKANFTKVYHPQATSHWIEESISLNKPKWLAEYKRNLLK